MYIVFYLLHKEPCNVDVANNNNNIIIIIIISKFSYKDDFENDTVSRFCSFWKKDLK